MTDDSSDPRATLAAPQPARSRFLSGIALLAIVALMAALGAAVLALRGASTTTGGAYATPPVLMGLSVVGDPANGTTVLFGGTNSRGAASDATWVWDGHGWVQAHPAHSPSGRTYAQIGYDPASHSVVLVGGERSQSSCGVVPIKGVPVPAVNGTAKGGSGSGNSGTSSGGAGSNATTTVTNGSASVICDAYGPLTDTWTWDGSDWHQAGSSDVSLTAMATDVSGQRLIGVGSAYSAVPYNCAVTSGGGSAHGDGGGTVVPGGGVIGAGGGAPGTRAGGKPAAEPTAANSTTAVTVAPSRSSVPPICGGSGSMPTYVFTNGTWRRLATASDGGPSYGTLTNDPTTGAVVSIGSVAFACPAIYAPSTVSNGASSDIAGGCCGEAVDATQKYACPMEPATSGSACVSCSVTPNAWELDGSTWRSIKAIAVPGSPVAYETSRHDLVAVSGESTYVATTLAAWKQSANAPQLDGSALVTAGDNGSAVLLGTARTINNVRPPDGGDVAYMGTGTFETFTWDGSQWRRAGPVPSLTPQPSATATPSAAPPTPCSEQTLEPGNVPPAESGKPAESPSGMPAIATAPADTPQATGLPLPLPTFPPHYCGSCPDTAASGACAPPIVSCPADVPVCPAPVQTAIGSPGIALPGNAAPGVPVK